MLRVLEDWSKYFVDDDQFVVAEGDTEIVVVGSWFGEEQVFDLKEFVELCLAVGMADELVVQVEVVVVVAAQARHRTARDRCDEVAAGSLVEKRVVVDMVDLEEFEHLV